LRNFSQDEITDLYHQHTVETGQEFEAGAIGLVWRQTQGQPWLVNAIAHEIVTHITRNGYQTTITGDMVSTAIQTIESRRDTHIDSLMARLREDRVRRIIEPVLTGEMGDILIDSDDYNYVKDLGLIRDDQGKIEPANPIYADIIVRTLNKTTQAEMRLRGYDYKIPQYLKDNIIDVDCLLSDFQVFWRENSDIWLKKYDYQEAAPQLILQAFLQRILNGGGQIIREMAAATGRADLCLNSRLFTADAALVKLQRGARINLRVVLCLIYHLFIKSANEPIFSLLQISALSGFRVNRWLYVDSIISA